MNDYEYLKTKNKPHIDPDLFSEMVSKRVECMSLDAARLAVLAELSK